MTSQQSGNVLFYILIAVALLAALSYSVSQSSRGSGSALSKEAANVYAIEVMEFGNTLSQAVAQIRLRGFDEAELSFENDTLTGYINPNCSGDECKIFHISGGGVEYQAPNVDWLDQSFSTGYLSYGDYQFLGQACTESTTCHSDSIDNEDLVLFVPYIKREVCLQINKRLGVPNPSGDAPEDIGCSGSGSGFRFTGAFVETISLKDAAGDLNNIAGCFKHGAGCTPSPNSYHYYRTLVER